MSQSNDRAYYMIRPDLKSRSKGRWGDFHPLHLYNATKFISYSRQEVHVVYNPISITRIKAGQVSV